MMKRILFLLTLAILSFTACKKKDSPAPDNKVTAPTTPTSVPTTAYRLILYAKLDNSVMCTTPEYDVKYSLKKKVSGVTTDIFAYRTTHVAFNKSTGTTVKLLIDTTFNIPTADINNTIFNVHNKCYKNTLSGCGVTSNDSINYTQYQAWGPNGTMTENVWCY